MSSHFTLGSDSRIESLIASTIAGSILCFFSAGFAPAPSYAGGFAPPAAAGPPTFPVGGVGKLSINALLASALCSRISAFLS
jgi:hypothetical protein